MKFLVAVIALFTVISVHPQTTTPEEDAIDAQIRRLMERPPGQRVLSLEPQKPNETRINGLTYSGILVELAKTDNPFQSINPAAPLEYGSPEDNVVRDPISGKVSGLKLFSIRF